MALAPVNTIGSGATAQAGDSQNLTSQATDAFGLSFQDLLKIVLTQLTYQDPLKPMDNFQFVSQLAQFSQIQQSQQMIDSLSALVTAQTTGQAASLLGKTVDVSGQSGTTSGKVVAVSFDSGNPAITIETSDGNTISSLPLSSVSQIREAN
jgi:flagellar basal-body rod modification protein FlgD